MLELAGMLPTLLELSMLPSVRLRLRQMLVFCTEDMDTVVLAMLVSAMLVLAMAMLPLLPMATLLLAMVVLAMLVMAMLVLVTMARGLLMLSQRLMLVCTMEDTAMVLVLDMLGLDMDILVLDMLDMVTVLDMAVGSTMVKQLIYASKSSKAIFLLFSALY